MSLNNAAAILFARRFIYFELQFRFNRIWPGDNKEMTSDIVIIENRRDRGYSISVVDSRNFSKVGPGRKHFRSCDIREVPRATKKLSIHRRAVKFNRAIRYRLERDLYVDIIKFVGSCYPHLANGAIYFCLLESRTVSSVSARASSTCLSPIHPVNYALLSYRREKGGERGSRRVTAD